MKDLLLAIIWRSTLSLEIHRLDAKTFRIHEKIGDVEIRLIDMARSTSELDDEFLDEYLDRDGKLTGAWALDYLDRYIERTSA